MLRQKQKTICLFEGSFQQRRQHFNISFPFRYMLLNFERRTTATTQMQLRSNTDAKIRTFWLPVRLGRGDISQSIFFRAGSKYKPLTIILLMRPRWDKTGKKLRTAVKYNTSRSLSIGVKWTKVCTLVGDSNKLYANVKCKYLSGYGREFWNEITVLGSSEYNLSADSTKMWSPKEKLWSPK